MQASLKAETAAEAAEAKELLRKVRDLGEMSGRYRGDIREIYGRPRGCCARWLPPQPTTVTLLLTLLLTLPPTPNASPTPKQKQVVAAMGGASYIPPHISPISRPYLAHISPISRPSLPHLSPISPRYLAHISPISQGGGRRGRRRRRRQHPEKRRRGRCGDVGEM